VTAAPDYVEPVVGWRTWNAVDRHRQARLASVIQRTVWPTRAPLVASCRCVRWSLWPFGNLRHEAPAAECGCGIYAASLGVVRRYLPEHLAESFMVRVIGRVALWGVVYEHDQGWRASVAYPRSLFVPVVDLRPATAKRILSDLRAYGVPVRPVDGSTPRAVIEEVTAMEADERIRPSSRA
jgi:hypothetical protein